MCVWVMEIEWKFCDLFLMGCRVVQAFAFCLAEDQIVFSLLSLHSVIPTTHAVGWNNTQGRKSSCVWNDVLHEKSFRTGKAHTQEANEWFQAFAFLEFHYVLFWPIWWVAGWMKPEKVSGFYQLNAFKFMGSISLRQMTPVVVFSFLLCELTSRAQSWRLYNACDETIIRMLPPHPFHTASFHPPFRGSGRNSIHQNDTSFLHPIAFAKYYTPKGFLK